MKFDKSQDSSWNALVVYVNSQCILAGLKPQNKFLFCILSYIILFGGPLKVLKNLEFFCKQFFCTPVFEVIRSSKNMLNISLKSKLVHYIIFEFCSIISLQSCWNIKCCNAFFECTQYIFAVLSFSRTIHSYLIKLYTTVKRHLNPSDVSCLDWVKHISQNHNYGS